MFVGGFLLYLVKHHVAGQHTLHLADGRGDVADFACVVAFQGEDYFSFRAGLMDFHASQGL